MKNINKYIIEKLHLNQNTKLSNIDDLVINIVKFFNDDTTNKIVLDKIKKSTSIDDLPQNIFTTYITEWVINNDIRNKKLKYYVNRNYNLENNSDIDIDIIIDENKVDYFVGNKLKRRKDLLKETNIIRLYGNKYGLYMENLTTDYNHLILIEK